MSIAGIGASVAGAAVGGLIAKKGAKSSSGGTQVQTTEPWSVAQPYWQQLYSQAGGLAGMAPPQLMPYAPTPEYFPYATTAAYDPAAQTLQGYDMALNYANNYLPGMTDAAFQSTYDMLNAPDVANNPYVQGMNAATTQDLTNSGLKQIRAADLALSNNLQNFGLASDQASGYLGRTLGNAAQNFQLAGEQNTAQMERALANQLANFREGYEYTKGDIGNTLSRDWLPQVRSGAGLQGQYGSSRQGIAEGVAMGDATKHLTDYGRSFNNQYGQAYDSAAMNMRDVLSNLGRDYAQTYESGATNTSNLISNLGRDYSQAYQAQSLGLGNAIEGVADAIAKAQATTNLGAYGEGLGQQRSAVQMMPQTAQLGMMPAGIYGQVGTGLDSLRQQQIDAERQRWDYEQQAPIQQMLDAEARAMRNYNAQWDPLMNMGNILSGGNFNRQTTNVTGANNPTAAALGGAMTGWDLGSQFGNWLTGGTPSQTFGAPAGVFTPENMGTQFGPPAPSMFDQWSRGW